MVGVGSYLPKKILTNGELEKMVDTSDEWIVSRTGIRERRIAGSQEATSDLAIHAAKKAVAQAKLEPKDIDLIIVATVTPDTITPAAACLVQKALGCGSAVAFDLNAACTGFIYALSCAKQFLLSGEYKTALVIGAEALSRITDFSDRNTCVLFGDGAGAVVLQVKNESQRRGLLASYLASDGTYADLLKVPAGGSRLPASAETVKDKLHYLKMDGNEVFKLAVQKMIEAALAALKLSEVNCQELDLIIPHQANIRIIEAMAKRLKIPMEKVLLTLQKYGNISAATTPIALEEAVLEGKIKKGDLVEMVAFGAGLTWGATVIKW